MILLMMMLYHQQLTSWILSMLTSRFINILASLMSNSGPNSRLALQFGTIPMSLLHLLSYPQQSSPTPHVRTMTSLVDNIWPRIISRIPLGGQQGGQRGHGG